MTKAHIKTVAQMKIAFLDNTEIHGLYQNNFCVDCSDYIQMCVADGFATTRATPAQSTIIRWAREYDEQQRLAALWT